MIIQRFEDTMAGEWDDFVGSSATGTFLHTRRYLSYHGNRFEDYSLVIRDEKNRMLALFPAALCPTDNTVVISHPGITYGGILASRWCCGEVMVRSLREICIHYAGLGMTRLQYKAVPIIYHRKLGQDDLYALFRLEAIRYGCDVSSTIDLWNRGHISRRRRNGYKKALQSGISLVSGEEFAPQLWEVLTANLMKHGVKPVHSLDEILLLHERFPDKIQFIAGLIMDRVEAGVVMYHTSTVSRPQYSGCSNTGHLNHAQDLIFEHCIADAMIKNKRYFDFGRSSTEAGFVLNEGLFNFKTEFGAGVSVSEYYEIDLDKVAGM